MIYFLKCNLPTFTRLGGSFVKVVGISWDGVPLNGRHGRDRFGDGCQKSYCHVIFVPEIKHVLHLLLYHCADEKSVGSVLGSECK